MASEREGLWGSPARQRSIASLKSRPHRKDRTGSCPVLGRPRFFRITTFESDMRRVLQHSAHSNPSLPKTLPVHLVVSAAVSLSRGPTGSVRQRKRYVVERKTLRGCVSAREMGLSPPGSAVSAATRGVSHETAARETGHMRQRVLGLG